MTTTKQTWYVSAPSSSRQGEIVQTVCLPCYRSAVPPTCAPLYASFIFGHLETLSYFHCPCVLCFTLCYLHENSYKKLKSLSWNLGYLEWFMGRWVSLFVGSNSVALFAIICNFIKATFLPFCECLYSIYCCISSYSS